MRGFESGKSFAENFKAVLMNSFKTMVLEPIIKPIAAAGGNLLSSIMGSAGGGIAGLLGLGTSTGAAASGGSGLLGGLLGAGGLFGAGGLSGALTAGAGWLTGSASLGGVLGAAGSLIGTGSAGGIMSGLAMGAGALGPIALGVALLASLDKGKTPHIGAATTTDAFGLSSINNGTALGLPTYGGFNSERDSKTATALQGLGSSVVSTLTMVEKAFGGDRQFTSAQAYLSDNNDPSRGYFRLWADGQMIANQANRNLASGRSAGYTQFAEEVAATTRAVLDDMDLPDWAQDTIDALSNTASLDELAAVATAIAETAGQLDAMSDALGPLGGVFARIGNLSSDAQYQLAQFAGGIDALAQKSAAFVQQYYSQDEQIGLQAADLARQFTALGITDGPDTMAEFRALVESQDLSTEQGRLQLAALLDMADQFAAVQAYIGQFGGTIDGLAANAPAGAVFGELTAAQERQAAIAQQQADLAARQAAAAEATVGAITTMSASLGNKLDAVRQALTEGFERQAAANDALRYGGV